MPGSKMWTCPQCKRKFTRVNQRHACGTGDSSQVLRNRPESVVQLYTAIEVFARSLGPIEVVARDRYVLLRSARIFADLVIMSDAVRIALHLGRQLDPPIFFKLVADRRFVTHVAKLYALADFDPLRPLLREAYDFSLQKS